MGMLHLVEVATFATVMDMAVKQKASVTCWPGCVSAKIIQRGTHATGARRVIMEIPGGSVVEKISYIADIATKFLVYSITVFRCFLYCSMSKEHLKGSSMSVDLSVCLLCFSTTVGLEIIVLFIVIILILVVIRIDFVISFPLFLLLLLYCCYSTVISGHISATIT
jgi:hypothetical protein